MRRHPAKYIFLPLFALAAIDLAPRVDAAPGDRDARSGSSVSSSRSSGGSTRSSGSSVGRSSGSSSRSSGSSVGRSSGSSSRSSGSTIGRSSGSSSRSSGSTIGRSSTSPTRPVVTGTSATPSASTGSSSPRIRYVAPTTSSTPSSTSSGQTPSYGSGQSGRTSSVTGTGEVYAPAPRPSAFPTPSNSGRTTYARRFDAAGPTSDPFANRRASTETGGTLGERGVGSVTSAIEAERRYRASTTPASPTPFARTTTTSETRVRNPHSPGANYRRALVEAQTGSNSASTDRERMTGEVRDRMTEDTRTRTTADAKARLAYDKAKTERTEAAKADLRETTIRRRMAAALDPAGSKIVSTVSDRIAAATGTAVAAATRPLVGNAGSRLISAPFSGDAGLTTSFDGYGTGGSDFTGYGDFGYGGQGCHSGFGFGWWDSFGNYHPPYSSPYSSWWGWSFGWSTSWGLQLSFGWNDCDYYGWGWGPSYYSPYSYYPSVVHHYYYDQYDEPDPIYIIQESEPVEVYIYTDGAVGEAVEASPGVDVNWVTGGGGAAAPASAPASSEPVPLSAAGLRYLELGDNAFSDMRFADAVHFYSRAIEFDSERGMLHLVLADALFATGDYHSCAHQIRRAIELEPSLVQAPVDKHQFYTDPSEFDRQLAVLELYVAEHPDDVDARLVLALNNLFGGRPLAALELLEEGPAARTGDQAAELIRLAADQARWGDNAPAEAGWAK